MSLVGKYDASNDQIGGSLFVYGEQPVASAKLNRWHGNIDAGFWLLHRMLRILAGDDGTVFLVDEEGNDPLLVDEQSTPDMTVKVSPGFALGPSFLVGVDAETTLPLTGTFTAPTNDPRIDAIGIRETGEWVIEEGTEAASPVAPTLDADTVELAHVYLRVGATSIKATDDSTNGYLIDQRPVRLPSHIHKHQGPETPPETPDGVITNFSTAERFQPGSLRVYVNGLQQIPTTHYTEDGDREGYTFVTAPPSGFVVHHEYLPG